MRCFVKSWSIIVAPKNQKQTRMRRDNTQRRGDMDERRQGRDRRQQFRHNLNQQEKESPTDTFYFPGAASLSEHIDRK
jgi:hypothetical protein